MKTFYILLTIGFFVTSIACKAEEVGLTPGNYGIDSLECGFRIEKLSNQGYMLKLINNPLNGVFCDNKGIRTSLLDLGLYGDKELICSENECLSASFKYTYYIGSYQLSQVLRYKVKFVAYEEFILSIDKRQCKEDTCTNESIGTFSYKLINNSTTVPAHTFVYWSNYKNPDLSYNDSYAKAMRSCFKYGFSNCREVSTDFIDIPDWDGGITQSISRGEGTK